MYLSLNLLIYLLINLLIRIKDKINQQRIKYDKEFKLSIVESYLNVEYSMTQLAIKHSIAVSYV